MSDAVADPTSGRRAPQGGPACILRDLVVLPPEARAVLDSLEYALVLQSGLDYLRALVEAIVKTFDCRYALVAEVHPERPGLAQTLAVCVAGKIVENFEYRLDGTPCERVFTDNLCVHESGIQHLYPQDRLLVEMQAECYLGVPLLHPDGTALGLLAVLDTRPIKETEALLRLLRIFGGRAAMELTKHRQELELRQTRRNFDHFVERTPTGIYFYELDAQDRLVFQGANPASSNLTGFDARPHQGHTLEEIFPGLVNTEIPQKYRQVARDGIPYSVRQVYYKDANIDSCFDVLAFQSGPNRVAVMFTDASERLHQERALIEAKEQAEAANRAKDNFLAIMSHELRTPLNPIIGFSQLLLNDVTNEDQRRAILTILNSAERMAELVREILDFSRIEQGKIELENRPCRLRELVQEALTCTQPRLRGNELELRWEMTPGGPQPEDEVLLDAGRFLQVLTNLLGNACKFTDHGRILLKVGSLGHAQRGWILVVAVEDNGIGIAPEHIQRIFEPFTQVDASALNRKFDGVGLGLAICRRIVRTWGGDIQVQSRVGQGSVFSFTLPLLLVSRQEGSGDAAGTQLRPGLRLLVVEDNDSNRVTILAMLRRLNVQAELVSDAQAALDSLRQRTPDGVLLDLGLPGMDGCTLARRIRALPQGQPLPLVAVTAHASEGVRQQALESGIDSVLRKPLRFAELSAELIRWFPA